MRHHSPIAVQTFAAPQSLPFVEVRTTLGSVQPYAKHFHSSLSLGMILEGPTRFQLHGPLHVQTYEAEEGDLVLIGPGVPHSCNPVGAQTRSYHMAHVDAHWFARRVCPLIDLPEDYEVALPLIRNPALFASALDIVRAVVDGQAHGEQALQAFLAQLQTQHRCFKPATAHASITAQFLPDEEESSLSTERHAVAQLAKKSGLCRESYSRAFRRGVGLSPGSYLHCLRLEKARRLLRQGKSIADAAIAVGYADQSHLHRMFVKFYSVTPGCYRRGGSHLYKK